MNFNRSVPTDSVLPHVMYRDVEEAIDWLTRAFGFAELYRYGDPVSGAQVRAGNAFLMLKRANDGESVPSQLGFGTQSLTIFVDDVEQHYERAKAAGAEILEEPHETVYGEFQYAARDLAGHHWLFSRHARDLNPEQWGAKVAQAAAPPARVAPMLSVRRGKAAVAFYLAAFGAEVLFQIEAPDGAVVAELSVGQSRFWVADESPEHKNFSPETLGGATARIVLVVDDPDATFECGLKAGATSVWPVEDQEYGWRVGRLMDPFGHHWEIGKPLQ
ncbi:MAG TPA: VOC family protein [Terracidiphilus sp.]|nr:VOC family protein [Terracidiphilus sp.]